MSRSLTVRKPAPREVRQLLELVEEPLESVPQRRAQAILLHNDEMSAVEIAATLQVHVNTIYADLHAFDAKGVDAVYQIHSPGAPPQLSASQKAAICRIADESPQEVGLSYGRWSLSKLRTYLIRQEIVKKISRKHLWLVLKKGGYASVGSSASWSVVIPNVRRYGHAFVGAGGICPPRGSCSFSMSNPWPLKPMEAVDIPRPNA